MASGKLNNLPWIVLGIVGCASILVLLLAPYRNVGVAVELPKTDVQSLSIEAEPIVISVDGQGRISIQDKAISLDDIEKHLLAFSDNDYDERIYLRAENQADYIDVIKVMGQIDRAGFTNIGLITDPAGAGN